MRGDFSFIVAFALFLQVFNFLENQQDTIVALATAPGVGAIGVIRLSGVQAVGIANTLFPAKDISNQPSHTLHVGLLVYKEEVIDEVVLSIFLAPKSYTGENIVEISCHGSSYILNRVIEACVAEGARLARAGEFTQRAFLNGKMDLTQAEAVADLIVADSAAAQQTALRQLRGGFSSELKVLRDELIHFTALIELELDFSEEDVEFADREALKKLIHKLQDTVKTLLHSFQLGNAIKNGIAVAIIGKPNAGKSTLLNALVNEERAIVSDIAGTTRDTIEEVLNISGVLFRLIDTAGIREKSTDIIENLGIERSKQNAEKADLLVHLIDASEEYTEDITWLKKYRDKTIVAYNKVDIAANNLSFKENDFLLSAKNKMGILELKQVMFEKATGGNITTESTIVTNARHYTALKEIATGLETIKVGMEQGLSGDLLTIDIRSCLHYLGTITGQVEVDRDILGTIFGKFCIGK